MNYAQVIRECLDSISFKERLTIQSKNLFNLKLEYFFRDQLAILLNEKLGSEFKSIAEYPRDKGKRVDLSICKKDKSKFDLEKMIELKYQYSGDFDSMSKYEGVFEKDFSTKKISFIDKPGPDFFILIVADWADKMKNRQDFEEQFTTPVNGFNHFQQNEKNKSKQGDWKGNVSALFRDKNVKLTDGLIEINGIVPTKFHYYIAERINE
jgi:hypothetical protein